MRRSLRIYLHLPVRVVSFCVGWHDGMNARVSHALPHRVFWVRCLCSFNDSPLKAFQERVPRSLYASHSFSSRSSFNDDADFNRVCLWSLIYSRFTFRRVNSTSGRLGLSCTSLLSVIVIIASVLNHCAVAHRSFHLSSSVSSSRGQSRFFDCLCE